MRSCLNQRGMTLYEVLMALAIGGVIMGATVSLIVSLAKDPEVIRLGLTATLEIRQASRWTTKDIMTASENNLVAGAPPVGTVNLTRTEWTDSGTVQHTTSYYLTGTNLTRNYDGAITTVARYISEIKFSRTDVVWPDLTVHQIIAVTIQCTPQNIIQRRQNLTYQVCLRSA